MSFSFPFDLMHESARLTAGQYHQESHRPCSLNVLHIYNCVPMSLGDP